MDAAPLLFTLEEALAIGAVGVLLGVLVTYYALVFAEWRRSRNRLPDHWRPQKG